MVDRRAPASRTAHPDRRDRSCASWSSRPSAPSWCASSWPARRCCARRWTNRTGISSSPIICADCTRGKTPDLDQLGAGARPRSRRSNARPSSCRSSADRQSAHGGHCVTDRRAVSPVVDLADRFWQWFLSRQPIYATVLGDERYDDRLADPSAEGRARGGRRRCKGFLDDAEADRPRRASTRRTRSRSTCSRSSRGSGSASTSTTSTTSTAIDQMAGPQNLPGDLSRFQRVDTPERVDRAIRRLEAFPALPRRAPRQPARRHRGGTDRGRAGRRRA